MTREEALARLRLHEGELRESGLSALYLFGSAARNDATDTSDVDLLFEVEDGRRFSLLDQASILVRLEDLLCREVDLVERHMLRPRPRARAEAEMVRVF